MAGRRSVKAFMAKVLAAKQNDAPSIHRAPRTLSGSGNDGAARFMVHQR